MPACVHVHNMHHLIIHPPHLNDTQLNSYSVTFWYSGNRTWASLAWPFWKTSVWFVAALVNKLVPWCAWLLSSALKSLEITIYVHTGECLGEMSAANFRGNIQGEMSGGISGRNVLNPKTGYTCTRVHLLCIPTHEMRIRPAGIWVYPQTHNNKAQDTDYLITTFIHSGYLYSAPSRDLLRGALSLATAKEKCLKELSERRHVVPGQQAQCKRKFIPSGISKCNRKG